MICQRRNGRVRKRYDGMGGIVETITATCDVVLPVRPNKTIRHEKVMKPYMHRVHHRSNERSTPHQGGRRRLDGVARESLVPPYRYELTHFACQKFIVGK